MMVVVNDNLENSDIRTKNRNKTSITTNDLPIKEILEQTI